MATVARNAEQALVLHKTRRGSDLTSRGIALQEIQDALGLADAPLRIECYDVSNLQGNDVVASMVVFEDGLARKSEYRRFVIRGQAGQGDTASISEVITPTLPALSGRTLRDRRGGRRSASGTTTRPEWRPRSTRTPAGRAASPTRRTSSSSTVALPRWRRPQRALDALGIDDVALCGLAKRLEEVWLPGNPHPVVLPRTSEGLYLLQRVRDEAHRFAIALHRTRRSKSMTTSALDGIPGLGETRRKALLRHFGSIKRLSAATAEEITVVAGIGPRTAEAIVLALAAREPAAPAVNTATGEILDEAADTLQPGRAPMSTEGEEADRGPASRAGDHHRDVRCRSEHRGQRAGGPRLVRRRQPAPGPAADARRARRPHARETCSGSRRWSTYAVGRSSPT